MKLVLVVVGFLVLSSQGAQAVPHDEWAAIAVLQDLSALGFLHPIRKDGHEVGHRPCFGDGNSRPAGRYELAIYAHMASINWEAALRSDPRGRKSARQVRAARDRLEWLWEVFAKEFRELGVQNSPLALTIRRRHEG